MTPRADPATVAAAAFWVVPRSDRLRRTLHRTRARARAATREIFIAKNDSRSAFARNIGPRPADFNARLCGAAMSERRQYNAYSAAIGSSCPEPEVRIIVQQTLLRTSGSKGH
jgi:hypothetical protein